MHRIIASQGHARPVDDSKGPHLPLCATGAGGYFFGTVPDGKRVLAALNRQRQLASPMLTLAAQTFCEDGGCAKARRRPGDRCAAHGEPAPAAFGSAYTCAIGDTVTAGTQAGPSCKWFWTGPDPKIS